MDQYERQVIDELFDKLRQAEAQAGPRDAQAEQCIREHVARQPAAPYLMAQTIVMQEQALAASQARAQELERRLEEQQRSNGRRAPAAAFFGGLFGGGGGARPSAPIGGGGGSPWTQRSDSPPMPGDPRVAAYATPYQQPQQRAGGGGGGFLAGAMQTAMGVAGGVLIGNALAGMFSPGSAHAGEPAQPAEDVPAEDEMLADDDGGGGFGDDEEF